MTHKQLLRAAIAQGWRMRHGKHLVLYAPDGKSMVVMAATPGDHRSFKNALSQMRRAGFKD